MAIFPPMMQQQNQPPITNPWFNSHLDAQTNYDIERQMSLAGTYQKQLLGDTQTGEGLYNKYFQNGKVFGKLNTGDMDQLANLYKGRLSGLSSPENAAILARKNQELASQYAGGVRDMRKQQAYSGVRGATASAQLEKLQRGQRKSEQDSYRDYVMQNVGVKQAAAADYAQMLQAKTQLEKYNIEQGVRGAQTKAGLAFGYAGLGAAERGAAGQFLSAMDMKKMQQEESSSAK